MRHFFGIPDEEFIRGDVPMTKCEIRKAVMNEARIEEDSIVLDVGAGTGSISIEAALAAPKGHVYAIERFDKGIDLINENMKKMEKKREKEGFRLRKSQIRHIRALRISIKLKKAAAILMSRQELRRSKNLTKTQQMQNRAALLPKPIW
mgnify:CR=1 FL=1